MLITHKKNYLGVVYKECNCSVCKIRLPNIVWDSNFCPNCGESLKPDYSKKEYYDFIEGYIRRISGPISLKMIKKALGTNFNLSPEYCERIVTDWNRNS